MCRSSITYVGIMLLLWLGIVFPTTQPAPVLPSAPSQASAPVQAAAERHMKPADAHDVIKSSIHKTYIGSATSQGDPDLSDVTLARSPMVVTPISFYSDTVLASDDLRSRQLLPHERPPKGLPA